MSRATRLAPLSKGAQHTSTPAACATTLGTTASIVLEGPFSLYFFTIILGGSRTHRRAVPRGEPNVECAREFDGTSVVAAPRAAIWQNATSGFGRCGSLPKVTTCTDALVCIGVSDVLPTCMLMAMLPCFITIHITGD